MLVPAEMPARSGVPDCGRNADRGVAARHLPVPGRPHQVLLSRNRFEFHLSLRRHDLSSSRDEECSCSPNATTPGRATQGSCCGRHEAEQPSGECRMEGPCCEKTPAGIEDRALTHARTISGEDDTPSAVLLPRATPIDPVLTTGEVRLAWMTHAPPTDLVTVFRRLLI
jgi:hypothetical protein